MLTKEDLLTQLKEFEIPTGRPVIVHSSLKSIGYIDGGAETLLSALMQSYCKDEGLLCIPTHTWKSMVLDLTAPETNLGALPQAAAEHPEGKRSLHPTHSITVFGNRAAEFIETEKFSDTPTNPEGCYGNIYKESGYVLLIGVGQNKNTMIHCLEEMLDVPGRLTDEKIEADIIHPDRTREKRQLYWFDDSEISDVSVYFGKFEPAFNYHGCIKFGKLGNADIQLCDVRKMKKVMDIIYERAMGRELLSDHTPLEENLYK